MSLNTPTKFIIAPDTSEATTPEWLARVRCPKTGLGGMTTSFVAPRMENGVPRNGYLVCEAGGTAYSIRGGIINLVPANAPHPDGGGLE